MNRILLCRWLFILALLAPFISYSQQITVKGKVTEQSNGLGIPGASVKVRGTTLGTLTLSDGTYTIIAPAKSILQFSFVGFVPKEHVAEANLSVFLQSAQKDLNEVVVTAQGIRRQARAVGYSIATINNTELNVAKPVDVSTGLTGKVSGLQINLTSNGVRPTTRVTLRGSRSILGNNQALVVVDNVISPADILSSLNPNDIESMSILKGANASALYGADGANGVILVTTKRGTAGVPTIRYSFTGQMENLAYLPPQNTRFGSYGGEGAGTVNGKSGNYAATDRDGFYLYQPYENQSFGPEFNGKLVPLGGPVQHFRPDGTFYLDTLKVPYSYHGHGVKDWFKTAYTVQHDISYSSGNKQNGFYFSAQDVNKTGVVPNERFERTGIRVNGTSTKGIFFIDYSAYFNRISSRTEGGAFFQNRPYYFNAFQTPGQVPINLVKDINSPYGDVNGFYSSYAPNPYWQAYNSYINTKDDRFLGSLAAGLKPTTWLTLTGRAGISTDGGSRKDTKNAVTFSPFALSDPTGTTDLASQQKSSPSYTRADQFSLSQITADFLANAKKKFGDVSIDLTLGSTLKDNTFRYQRLIGDALVIPNFFNISNVSGVPRYNEVNTQQRLIGYYGDLTVSYKNWLFLNVTGRRDITSLLSKANRAYFYPQANLGIVFTDLIPGFKDNHFLTYGKISGSLTKVYQVDIQPYSLQNFYTLGNGFPFGSQTGYGQSFNTLDPNIRPEQTVAKEAILELGFLDGRINFKGAYYKENTKDQTLPVDISATTGYTSAQINTGELENHGLEFDLNITPLISLTNGLRWNVGANLSIVQNKVLALYKGLDQLAIQNTLGTAFTGNADVYAVTGLPYPVIKTPDFFKDPQGRTIVDPVTGLPSVNSVLQVAGQTNPKYRLGLNTSISFKGLTLSATMEYRAGNVILNGVGQALDFGGTTAHSTENGRQRFVWPNSSIKNADGSFSPNKNITVNDGGYTLWSGFLNSAGAAGTPYVTSAAFWKLRELALTYTLPTSLLDKTHFIKGVSIGLVGRNLFLWRPKSNQFTDPEFSEDNSNATGFTTANQTPPTRLYGVTASISF